MYLARSLSLIAQATNMAMSKTQAEAQLAQIIPLVSKHIYDGKKFTVFDGFYEVVPKIVVQPGGIPNGNLTPIGNGMGVAVSQGLLSVSNDAAITFGLAHELGHGFKQTLLEKLDMGGISGCVTEIAPDLGAAYTMNLAGWSWTAIKEATRNGVAYGIFDLGWSGDHPPGEKRATCVASFVTLVTSGESFLDATKAICLSMQGYKPV